MFYIFISTGTKTFNMVAVQNIRYLFMYYQQQCNNYVARKHIVAITLKLQKHKATQFFKTTQSLTKYICF